MNYQADADDTQEKTVVQQKRLLDKRTHKKKQLADKVTTGQKFLEKTAAGGGGSESAHFKR